MGGSASIQCKEKKIYGHDGLMGSQLPIGVGYCFATKKPTIVFIGDSAAEEDYVLSAIGWAVTKKLPILFVVEDNNMSTNTPTSETWNDKKSKTPEDVFYYTYERVYPHHGTGQWILF
jgi:pyruvate dehydrogenase E1 component alpha subunit